MTAADRDKNCAEELFAGSDGVSNLLIGLLGTEAVVEWRYERLWNPETETELEDVSRQILPVLAVSERNSGTMRGDGILEMSGELELLIPAVHLKHPVSPVTTRVLFQKRVWLVTEAVPEYAGGIPHLWRLKLKLV